MPEAHMKYGGSTIERIELCPGSAEACTPFRGLTNEAAERGTRIHRRVEQIWNLKHKKGYVPTVEDAAFMATLKKGEEEIAQNVVKTLERIALERGFSLEQVEMEKRVTLHHIHPQAGGTADHVAFQAFGDLLVADTKAGYNFVGAASTLQLPFYASGVMQSLDEFTRATIQNIHLVILQPEQEYPYNVNVNVHVLPAAEIAKYDARFMAAITRAEAEPHVRNPGKHCADKYCDARTTCQPYQLWLNQKTSGAFAAAMKGSQQLPGVGVVLAEQLEHLSDLRKFATLVENQAKSILQAVPDAVPNWTLKDSMSNRAFADLKKVDARAKELGLKSDEYKPREVITPAAFERLLESKGMSQQEAAERIEDLTTRSVSGQKLVKTDEPVQSLGDKFRDLINAHA